MNLSTIQSLFGGASSGPRVENMSGSTAVQFFSDPDSVFVDVRGADEIRMTGTIKGAIRAPLPEFARHARPEGGGSLPPASAGKTIILVCASGARSGAAARHLIEMGYEKVANIGGGIGSWKMAGGPMER